MKNFGKGKYVQHGSLQSQINAIKKKKDSGTSNSSIVPMDIVPTPPTVIPPKDSTCQTFDEDIHHSTIEIEWDIELNTAPSVPRRRRCNKNITLNKQTAGGEKLLIHFNETRRRPIGKNNKLWSRHIGAMVKQDNIISHCTESWKKLAPTTFDILWQSGIDKFDAEDIEIYRDATMRQIKSRWEDWRHRLNVKYIRPYNGDKDKIKSKCLSMMIPENWHWLLDHYYFTDSYKKVSATNAENKTKLKYHHSTGSKSFSELEHEMVLDRGDKLHRTKTFFCGPEQIVRVNMLSPLLLIK